MKHILDISFGDSVAFNHLLPKYKDLLYKIDLSIREFTCRYSYKTTKLIMDCSVLGQDKYHIHAYEENYVMLSRNAIRPFDVTFILKNGHAEIIERPNDKDIVKWLYTFLEGKKRMTKDELGYVFFHCLIALNLCNSILIKRQVGNTIYYSFPKNFNKIADEYLTMKKRKEHEENRFNGWDVVLLTSNQLQKLGEVLESHQLKHDFRNIPLTKYCLDLYHTKEKYHQYYFMEYKKPVLYFNVEDSSNDYVAHCSVTIKETDGDAIELELSDDTNAMEWLTHYGECENEEDRVMHWQWMVDVFFSINTFMLNFGDVTMDVETKVAQKQSEPATHSKKAKRNSVRLFKSYKLVKNWRTQARKKAEITCPDWGVRGHFRHYRNGKVIFVESYVKGPEKAKYAGKEYTLFPYKDA